MTKSAANIEKNENVIETFACHTARILSDSRCENIVVLDLRDLSQVTDFFVIATSTSEQQMHSVARDLKLFGKHAGQSLFRWSGNGSVDWVVMDFVNVVTHLFIAGPRAYYNLESLWDDAKEIDWLSRSEPGQFTKLLSRLSHD